MDENRFDDFTRSLAGGVSRRTLLRGLGGMVGLLALTGVKREASASNSDCAHFCNAVFGPGPARGTCKSDGAKHVPGNLCDACESNLDNLCASPAGEFTCCTGDETCDTATGICEDDGVECELLVLAQCVIGPGEDLCCGTLMNDPDGSICVDVSDIYPDIGARCCIPNNTGIPCAGFGGDHCDPETDCSVCCTGYCGPLTGNPKVPDEALCGNAPV